MKRHDGLPLTSSKSDKVAFLVAACLADISIVFASLMEIGTSFPVKDKSEYDFI